MQEITGEQPSTRPAPAEPEFHVAGVLVHAVARDPAQLRDAIAGIPGAQVHGAAEGKVVVTLEAASTGELLDRLSRLQALPGVVSALPIYQHSEPVQAIDEEEVYGD